MLTPSVLAAQERYYGRSTGVVGALERLFFIEVVSFDWNCPKYIAPRYTKRGNSGTCYAAQSAHRRTGSQIEA